MQICIYICICIAPSIIQLLTFYPRKIGASKEQARREQMAEQRANGGYDGAQDEEEEDYMEF
jgi:hypothetical protein